MARSEQVAEYTMEGMTPQPCVRAAFAIKPLARPSCSSVKRMCEWLRTDVVATSISSRVGQCSRRGPATTNPLATSHGQRSCLLRIGFSGDFGNAKIRPTWNNLGEPTAYKTTRSAGLTRGRRENIETSPKRRRHSRPDACQSASNGSSLVPAINSPVRHAGHSLRRADRSPTVSVRAT
jgi:hypothetical protein